MNNLLVIDDEEGIRAILKDIFEDENYSVILAEDGIQGLKIIEDNDIDLVILDVWLPNMGGIDVLQLIKEKSPDTEVIIISGHANIDLAVKAVKLGAYDFMEKPLSLEKIITLARNALKVQNLRKENRSLKSEIQNNDKMIGDSPAMLEVRKIIEQASDSDARILILGENGTGKELVARQIHARSSRARLPFVEVNCAAIPDTIIESELFGHEKGSFTSAVARRKGKFEIADTGTLFLDEVADMSLSAQAKVLRAIQEMKFERVGGETSVSVDVRIISATNKDIRSLIDDGKFREDLFFRLNVIPIQVPALRERIEDIPVLLKYFLAKFRKKTEETERGFSDDAMNFLMEYSWPGNIRELKNFVERISIMVDDVCIPQELAEQYLGKKTTVVGNGVLEKYKGMKLNDAKDLFEKMLIEDSLKQADYSVSTAAQNLGLYPSNLHAKMKRYGIETKK